MVKKWLHNLSFKNRIWLSFALLICLGIGLSGLMTYYIVADVMKRDAFAANKETLEKTVQVLDEKLRSIVVSTSNIILNDTFKQMVNRLDSRSNQASFFQYLSDFQTPFSQMSFIEPYVDSMLIVTPMGDFYPTDIRRNHSVTFEDTQIYAEILEAKSSVWIGNHVDPFFAGDKEVLSFILAPYISPTRTSGQQVYIIVNITTEDIQQMITQNLNDDRDQLSHILIDRNGNNVLTGKDENIDPDMWDQIQENQKGEYELRTNGNSYLVNYSQLTLVDDWVLLRMKDRDDILQQISWIKWTTLSIAAVCFLLSFVFANTLTSFLVTPLRNLQHLMGQVELNNLDLRYSSHNKDEFTQVGEKFNEMLDRIQKLMAEMEEVNIQKKKSEIKALQAQVDPHFLYNTLSTIYIKTQMGESEEAGSMVISLSNMFKLGLNNGKEMTTISKELDHVKQYLELQKQCYEELFEYDIQVADHVDLQQPILKLILQPLVENSIFHGFENMESGGLIEISVKQLMQDGRTALSLQVKDNGSGMDGGKVSEEMKNPQSNADGYALKNVYSRLKLYYGEDAQLDIASTFDMGAEISVIIPMEGGKDEHE